DRLHPLDLGLAYLQAALHHFLKVVDVVEEDVGEFRDLGGDVAGDGDVDEEDRAAAARPHRGLEVHAAAERLRRAGGADGDGAAADFGFRARALAGGEGVLKEGMNERAAGPGVLRALERLLHLRQDLRLADDHRVEAGSDAEEVPDGGRALEAVEMLLD